MGVGAGLRDQLMKWPERPLCHDADATARYGIHHTVEWRPPDLAREPAATGLRTCNWCGSVHPEDLWNLVHERIGVRFEPADRKYGWPHKFYVDGVPNVHSGDRVECGGRYFGSRTSTRPCIDQLGQHAPYESDAREATEEELFAAGWRLKTETTIRSYRDSGGDHEESRYERESWYLPFFTAGSETTQVKWYNEHLLDLWLTDESTAKAFANMLHQQTGIVFTVDANGRLGYRG